LGKELTINTEKSLGDLIVVKLHNKPPDNFLIFSQERVKVPRVPLGDGDQDLLAHETPEFEGRREIEPLAEDQFHRIWPTLCLVGHAVKSTHHRQKERSQHQWGPHERI